MGGDPLASQSFTARRPAASSLPTVDLPPPPLSHFGHHKQPAYAGLNSTHPGGGPASSVANIGNLPTPPTTQVNGDGLSPFSEIAQLAASGQAISGYPQSSYWARNQQPQYAPYTPSGSQYRHGPLSPSSLYSIARGSSGMQSSTSTPPHPSIQGNNEMYQLPPFGSLSMPGSVSSHLAHSSDDLVHSTNPYAQTMSSMPQMPALQSQMGPDGYSRQPPTPNSFHASQASPTPSLNASTYSVNSLPPHGSRLSPSSMHHDGSGVPSPSHYQKPFGQFTLPSVAGPVMSNMHTPGNSMSMIQGLPTSGMMAGFAPNPASMHSLYSMGHALHQSAPSPPNERPFKCDQCMQSFNRNHDLKRHKRIHLAVKPYPCLHCDKSFSRKDALKRHILVKGCGKSDDHPNSPGDKHLRTSTSDGSDVSMSPSSHHAGLTGMHDPRPHHERAPSYP